MNESAEQLEDANPYEIKKQQKEEERLNRERKTATRKIGAMLGGFILLGLLGGGVFLLTKQQGPETPRDEVLTRSGMHWHSSLAITIKGEKRVIPEHIGLGMSESPIHTHEQDGIVHLEFAGLVKKEDVRLGEFFDVWGKKFSGECIFEFCNGEQGNLRMKVNGEENTEFEKYLMRDGDKIEIVFE